MCNVVNIDEIILYFLLKHTIAIFWYLEFISQISGMSMHVPTTSNQQHFAHMCQENIFISRVKLHKTLP